MTKLIKNWEELSQVPDSDTHRITTETYGGVKCFGWIREKHENKPVGYLSTHTFYKKSVLIGSDILKRYGFDIELVSGDEDNE